MRASGSDKAILLTPPINFSIERAIEYIANDELVEVTPNHLRFRKRILDANDRRKAAKRARTSPPRPPKPSAWPSGARLSLIVF